MMTTRARSRSRLEALATPSVVVVVVVAEGEACVLAIKRFMRVRNRPLRLILGPPAPPPSPSAGVVGLSASWRVAGSHQSPKSSVTSLIVEKFRWRVLDSPAVAEWRVAVSLVLTKDRISDVMDSANSNDGLASPAVCVTPSALTMFVLSRWNIAPNQRQPDAPPSHEQESPNG